MAGYRSPFPQTHGLRADGVGRDDSGITIVVPFYNEEDCVEFVLEEIRECQPDAEVIANVSSDVQAGCGQIRPSSVSLTGRSLRPRRDEVLERPIARNTLRPAETLSNSQ